MSASSFVLVLVVAAGALAVWTHARVPRLAPDGWKLVTAHVAASMVVLNVVTPAAMQTAVDTHTAAGLLGAVVGVALPSLTYVLLSALWLLWLAQRLLGRAGN